MSLQSWQETLISLQADGPALSNTTTATSLLPAAAKYPHPANWWANIGKLLRVRAAGRISNAVSAVLTLDLRLGSTVVANGGAMTLNATSKTNVSFWLEWLLTLRAVGSAANLFPQGIFISEASPAAAAGSTIALLLPASAPAVGNNFDAGASQVLDLFGTWGAASASNSIQVHEFFAESLN